MIVVVDTSVLVSAMLGPGGASREVLRRSLRGLDTPLMGQALFAEYEAAMAKEALFAGCVLTEGERAELLDAFLSTCRWTQIYYGWRPNIRDETDNHVVELAVAGGAEAIVTKNLRDFASMELRFEGLRILSPQQLIKG
jgi:putative PIN family toxin of toxin-antitoxin system